MSNLEINQEDLSNGTNDPHQRGSAIVIALLILVLLSVFVALALSRTASEAAAVGNEASEGRTFYAAQGSLEVMTRNFNEVFETKINPSDAAFDPVRNINPVRAGVEPGLAQYTFNREVLRVDAGTYSVINEGPYAGLYATRDNWRLRTTATDPSGIQVQLTRNILNNRIPIFQFGIFYNDNLEFHPGPNFDFGGRVHSNGSLFLSEGPGKVLYFDSRVSTAGEIVTDVRRNGSAPGTGVIKIKNGVSDVVLTSTMGSVLKTPANGVQVFQDPLKPALFDTDMPTEYTNAGWIANEALFGGNLLAHQKSLDLPLKIASAANGVVRPLDYIELIKRGRNVGAASTDLFNDVTTGTVIPVTAANRDSDVTVSEKYYNKTGIRISLSDRKAKLPGCASGTGISSIAGECGKRLDGDAAGDSEGDFSAAGTTRGYQPKQMMPLSDNYIATRLNGNRFGTSGTGTGRQMWIKIELVSRDAVTDAIITKDVTADILSLGVTEAAPCIQGRFWIQNTPNYYTGACNATNSSAPFIDSRSVIKLQRFVMPGADFVTPTASAPYMTNFPLWDTQYAGYNLVQTDECSVGYTSCTTVDTTYSGEDGHKKNAVVDLPTTFRRIVPFPIEMFDSREGIYNSDIVPLTVYGTKVPWAGVMSMIDIDVANLKKFLEGNFNANMPNGTNYYTNGVPSAVLINTAVPQNSGWVIYVSDRRGDSDFDGEYDMEDIYGNNDGILQKGEDVNSNGILDIAGLASGEAISYTGAGSSVPPGQAASVDHQYYRRGVRLINGQTLPGTFDSVTSANTRGFTVASENGVYVQGNYNATGIRPGSTGAPTPSEDYFPQGAITVNGVAKGTVDGANHIPASIVADAVTILSNYNPATKEGWSDSKSFLSPFDINGSNPRRATQTFTRFAMLAGDAQSSLANVPNQGAADARLGGGVHNFKRFLEDWGNVRLNYCGSLINLYNARNNNGSYKSSGIVYSPPDRNWIFDSSFLDPNRLPPGTPYFQYVQTTGFQRTNN